MHADRDGTGQAHEPAEEIETPALVATPRAPSATRPKPSKPYADFPLFPHATRRWAKKIGGRFEFFGPWEDPYGALDRYLARRDGLFLAAARGRSPTARGHGRHGANVGAAPPQGHSNPSPSRAGTRGEQSGPAPARPHVAAIAGLGADGDEDAITVRDLVNRFLTAKRRKVDAGEMGLRSFGDYHGACARLVKVLGAGSDLRTLSTADFARLRADIASTKGPVALTNELGRVRSVFKYALDAGHVDRPIRFGPEFSPPPRKAMREARRGRGLRMFEPDEIVKLVDMAAPQMRAMVLLGVNAGFGNSDLASLHRSAVDLKTGVIDFPRPKTGIARRAILWPETIDALRAVMGTAAGAPTDLVFRTPRGHALVRADAPKQTGTTVSVVRDAVAVAFGKLTKAAGLTQPGRGFYALRHTFRTIAEARLLRLGFSPGGAAPYGLRRAIVDAKGNIQAKMERGEHKYLQTDRVSLVPGPESELKVLRWIFKQVADKGVPPSVIVRSLIARGVPCMAGTSWTTGRIQNMLINEKYIGNLVFNRKSMKLGARSSHNEPNDWIRCDHAIQPVVDQQLFDAAQQRIAAWSTRITNDAALRALRDLLARRHKLSAEIIDADRGMPGSYFYYHRFGGLTNAYRLVGYSPSRCYKFLPGFGHRCKVVEALRVDVRALLIEMGASVSVESRPVLVVHDVVRLAVFAARCTQFRGQPRWEVQMHIDPRPNHVLVVRLEPDESIKDYFLFEGGSQSYLMGVKHRERGRPRDRRQSLSMKPLLQSVIVSSKRG